MEGGGHREGARFCSGFDFAVQSYDFLLEFATFLELFTKYFFGDGAA
jgi:hypothetical protein